MWRSNVFGGIMKKNLLFCVLIVGIMNAAEQFDELIPSLKELCIQEILMHPREYIERDGEHVLNKDVQNAIRKKWYKHEVIGKLRYEEYPRVEDPYTYYSSNGFLSKKIPLAQLLLLRARSIVEEEDNEKNLILTQKEQETFNSMLPFMQEEVKPYIKKSFLATMYDILFT